jgi:RNA polymerase sigma-70 factor (ECF subfamily)
MPSSAPVIGCGVNMSTFLKPPRDSTRVAPSLCQDRQFLSVPTRFLCELTATAATIYPVARDSRMPSPPGVDTNGCAGRGVLIQDECRVEDSRAPLASNAVREEPHIAQVHAGALARRIEPQHAGVGHDRELIERVKRGDATAYDVLVRRYLAHATSIARRLLGDPDDAEDLVQDAFVRALSRIGSFDEGRAFGPWFFRLLINTGLNARKFRSLRSTETERRDVPSSTPTPLELAERDEIRQRFADALAALPARQRLVVSLFEVDGLTTVEIATMLGISRETVRWHHHQARHTLRRALAALRE